MTPVVSALIGLLVLAWIVYNQLRPREVTNRRLRIAGVLGVVGLVQVTTAASGHPVSALALGLLVLGLVIGAGLGVGRAYTMRAWTAPDGRRMIQGNWVTAALWLVGIAVHVGLDLLVRAFDPASEPVNTASIMLFVAVSIGAQALVAVRRSRALTPAGV